MGTFALSVAGPKGLSPAESLKRFKIPGDLEIEQVLAEPIVRQPVFVNFDERGRMWVVQYLQYPNPAGLKIQSRDIYWRIVYDKVPPPPPKHFRGKDKITIHEDTKGNGVFDKHTTFVDGLNIVTAVVRGRGGVWVLNPPYLLFYREKNDVPDGDPEVHLEGFGLEDTHSVVNSLCWGPDGWLYGAQGSTVTAQVKVPARRASKDPPVYSMGQLIWRYHPEKRIYEIFAEGGGNAFGVEIDEKGRIYSGHNGGNTRGFHYVQGGYYQKGFSKHGPISNPYAFGYFPAMRHPNVPRFSHTFVKYEAPALPAHYRGKLFAVNPMNSQVVESEIKPDGSSFQTRDLSFPITTTDNWFRPVDIKIGPDGNLYVADWYDSQINHYRNHEGKIDPSTGRIYRLKAKGAKAKKAVDLGKLSTAELIGLLGDDNRWTRQTALRLIGDLKDGAVIPQLKRLIKERSGQIALEALWALNLSGGLNESVALETLTHADPYVRLWTIRLLGDDKHVSPAMVDRLVRLAKTEPHLEVRSQLACTARRLPASACLPIIRQLLTRSEDVNDIHIPLLLWWAVEAKAESDRAHVVKMFSEPTLWRLPMVEKHVLERLMRRYAQAGKRDNLLTCAELLRIAPDKGHVTKLLAGFEQAYAGGSLANLPDELIKALAQRGGGSLAIRLRQGQAEAVAQALKVIANEKASTKERLALVQIFGEIRQPQCVPVLLKVVAGTGGDRLRQAALAALLPYDDADIAARVISLHNGFSRDTRAVAQSLLVSRPNWARQFLQAVDAGDIKKKAIPHDLVRKMTVFRDERIAELIRKNWGQVQGATTAEMQKQIEHYQDMIKKGTGSPYAGKKLFAATCAKCHMLFGKGGFIGPDLTSAKRDDLPNLLLNIVNPGAEIREGFETYLIRTQDGRALTGFVLEQDNRIVLLRNSEGVDISLAKKDIADMRIIPQSIMPEGLLSSMSEQQIRDLFAYLRSSQPLND
jgi:putative heme-binding domain-containing protein